MANFVVQFPLRTEPYQEDILSQRLNVGRMIYNALVNVTQKRYDEMKKTRKYRELSDLISKETEKEKNRANGTGKKPKKNKELVRLYKQKKEMLDLYGINEYSFHKDVKDMQKHFKECIDSFTAQKIGTELWSAYRKLIYGDGKEIHYKKYGTMKSLEGKSNLTGLTFRDGCVIWKKLRIPVIIDYDNYYENEAMKHDIAYCRIVKKYTRHRDRYYVQIIFDGVPPCKIDKKTGETKHLTGTGDVGIDIGTSTVAVSSATDVRLEELADRAQGMEREIWRLKRKMDRSRRAMNPDNYDKDGVPKKQGNKKVKWINSNHYLGYRKELRYIYRRQADIRRYQHECLSNYIISLGDNVYVEKMNFKALQKRAKETTKNKKGKYNCKKRFGKSLANRAPAMLLTMIDRKLKYNGTELHKINTMEAKASQYDHVSDTYKKKSLSQRWNDINGIKVQRDMYSAFLIMNINDDLETFDEEKCKDRFANFLNLHDMEVRRLTGRKNLSSMGI